MARRLECQPAMTPYESAVSLFDQGLTADLVLTRLRVGGISDEDARIVTQAAWSRVRGTRAAAPITITRPRPVPPEAPRRVSAVAAAPSRPFPLAVVGVGLYLTLQALPAALFCFFALSGLVRDLDAFGPIFWSPFIAVLATCTLAVVSAIAFVFMGRDARRLAFASLTATAALHVVSLAQGGHWRLAVWMKVSISAPISVVGLAAALAAFIALKRATR